MFHRFISAFIPVVLSSVPAIAQTPNLEFDSGVKGWRTVLDGVMGGLSTGRVSQEQDGVMRFQGELSLENNGGFSQTQTSVPEGFFEGREGLELRVKGDGRRYQFDVRCSNVRLMAGSYQFEFDTKAGEWMTVEMPFDAFRLYNFGRKVGNAPELRPEKIESVGITLADKKAGAFAIDVDHIRPLGGRKLRSADDLQSVAEAAGLKTLLALVNAAGLSLPEGQKFTIFAPTDDAFAKLPAEKVKFLTSPEGKATLTAILKHHVVAGAVDSADVLSRRSLKALSNQVLPVDADAMTVAGSKIVASDVSFNAGIVHVIDAVMVPELRSIVELLAERSELSTLRKAVDAAGIGSQLASENPGPWTLLAPTDEAFAALPAGALDSLIKNPDSLIAVLTAHVIPSSVRRSEMPALGAARTLAGATTVTFALRDGAVTASGAKIVSADIQASNGVIHTIDRVLIPESKPEQSAGMSAVDPARVASIIELAIERGAPMFNEGEKAACAAIYEVAVTSIITLGKSAVDADGMQALKKALRDAAAEKDPSERAWIYRRAMDKVYAATATTSSR